MDDVLKELKRVREETEKRWWEALERAEQEHERLAEMIETAGETKAAGEAIALLRAVRAALAQLTAAAREIFALHNARSAELARQLTVLPLERMDLALDAFARRIEDLEVRLQRLESPSAD